MIARAITTQNKDRYYGVTWQVVTVNGERKFSVSNIDECPEDAIIGRSLFDAGDYINAVKFGMTLASLGYTDIDEVVEYADYRD